MKKHTKPAPQPRITTVAQGDNWRIDREAVGDCVDFVVYIDGELKAARGTQPEAQAWRDEYVYEQLRHAA